MRLEIFLTFSEGFEVFETHFLMKIILIKKHVFYDGGMPSDLWQKNICRLKHLMTASATSFSFKTNKQTNKQTKQQFTRVQAFVAFSKLVTVMAFSIVKKFSKMSKCLTIDRDLV